MIQKSQTMSPVKTAAPVKVVSAELLADRINNAYESIARRAFEIFQTTGGAPGHDLEHWFKAESELFRPMTASLTETAEAFQIRAEVPGFEGHQLHVCAEPRKVTIIGKRETRNERKAESMVYSEQRSEEVFRVFNLAAEINPATTAATLKEGTLAVTLPKKGAQKTLRIEPKAAA